ncbi:hypothetical protein LINGRAHAP2_LOCUS2332, partial [Linum grandiflorum]
KLGCNWTRKLRFSYCWRRVRSHTSTSLRSSVSVRCLSGTEWSKLSIFIGKATDQLIFSLV